MGRNLTEGALDKAAIAFRCPIELKYKMLVKFGKNLDDNLSDVLIKALETAAGDVQLTKEAVDRILDEEAEAYKKRMRARLLRDQKRGNT